MKNDPSPLDFLAGLKTWQQLGIIFLLTFLAYSNIYQCDFILDDHDYVVNWPLIQDWKNFPKFFFGYVPPPGQEGVFSPLKTLFHAINYHLFGLNPVGHHVAAVLYHLIALIFVYKIILELTGNHWLTFVGTLLFGVHPIHPEYVSSITGSVDNIGNVFLFAAFYYYLKWHHQTENRRLYIIAVVLAALAMYTHELMLSLPILFLWYEFCFAEKKTDYRMFIKRMWPFFAIALSYVLAKQLAFGAIARSHYLYDSFYLTMLLEIKALAKYVLLIFFPIVLSHNHVISSGIFSFDQDDFDKFAVLSQSIFDVQVLASLALIIAIFYWAYRKFAKQPLLTFCVGWFFIGLLPGLNIVPSGVYFAERYLYPGSLTFCLLAAYYLDQWRRHGGAALRWANIVVAILVIFYMGRTWVRNLDSRNDVVLFESVVRDNPHSANMHNDLGIVYTRFEQYDKAIDSFRQALVIRPNNPVTHFAMAEAYMQIKNYIQAIESLKKAIELNPEYADAYYNLAGLYAFQGLDKEAKESLEKSIVYYKKQGRTDEARDNERAFYSYFGYFLQPH